MSNKIDLSAQLAVMARELDGARRQISNLNINGVMVGNKIQSLQRQLAASELRAHKTEVTLIDITTQLLDARREAAASEARTKQLEEELAQCKKSGNRL